MTDPIKHANGFTLDSLRVQFESVAEELAFELATIVQWLHMGGARPEREFIKVTDDMNEVRFLMGEIERVTKKAQ